MFGYNLHCISTVNYALFVEAITLYIMDFNPSLDDKSESINH